MDSLYDVYMYVYVYKYMHRYAYIYKNNNFFNDEYWKGNWGI